MKAKLQAALWLQTKEELVPQLHSTRAICKIQEHAPRACMHTPWGQC